MTKQACCLLIGILIYVVGLGLSHGQTHSRLEEIDEVDPESFFAESAKSQKDLPPESPKQPKPAPINERAKIDDQLSADGVMTLNFPQVDIRKLLSALAMKREVNIVMAKEVSGEVSLHLFQVTLEEALHAITLAGGFGYHKFGDMYFVYKPKKIEDPKAPKLTTRAFKLKYTDVKEVKEILDAIPDMRLIKIHEPSKTIIVEDTQKNIKRIEAIIRFWDTKPKQVMIEAKILEVNLTDDMSLGIDWDKILGSARFTTGGFSNAILPDGEAESPVGTGTGLFANIITGAGTAQQFAAALDALQRKTKVNMLSTPRVLAIHGKPAKVQVGGQQGYPVTTTNLGVATETIEFIDTGIVLEITPYIDDMGNVLMNVKPSITSAVIEKNIPVTSTAFVTTWFLAKSGETVLIGGLIQDSKTKTRNAIPCLGNIPGLGLLFGRSTREIDKSELVVLITPQVLDTGIKRLDQEEAIEKTKRIEEKLKKEPLPPVQEYLEFLIPLAEPSEEGPKKSD
jgi:type II secretory pathway component GspD/PulD (secretin)